MFGSEFGAADDGSVVAAIQECARAEAVWAARRLAAVAELTARYTEPDEEREHLAVDGWRMASAEVSAAMRVGDRAASGQMCIAMALRERLPKVAALFARGQLSAAMVSAITWRTQLVVDSQTAERIDTAIAARAGAWGVLSVARLEAAIDAVVDQYDPDARRRLREAARNRDVRVGKRDDVTGTMSLWGRLSTADGELLERRLAQMASQVCPDDPRTTGQRRSEAIGAIAAGAEGLSCRCGNPQCPSPGTTMPAQPTSSSTSSLTPPPLTQHKPKPRQHQPKPRQSRPNPRQHKPNPPQIRPKPQPGQRLSSSRRLRQARSPPSTRRPQPGPRRSRLRR
ncbi:hypothetical protein AU198_13960 [Mycobacterium sp. GA-1199]|uniref:DUF222 domain-containing protein n=1 Tax=Mycobacterium sp. GA-1199 TaxID=1772287 RepID=UPI0007469699|nr:DUF222 domain-containing protein [Mycobacterium sp. GA-1199]KUI44651.1 hypothetical protein AU198_13960 [Mycobacterium sp. GA-1199]